jgi:hypothetical protein
MMSLTYEETYDLSKDAVFRGRVAVASTHYAVFITDEPANTPAHSTRYKWAQSTLANVEGAVAMVITTVCNDAAVQTDGAAITDAALQSTVETAVNKLL